MDELIDIQGLDYIGWWPLAIGWWLLIGMVLVIFGLVIFYLYKRYKYRNSWQYQAYKKLSILQGSVPNVEHKQVLQNLSLEMRKIAMLSTQRQTCAGLIGKQWLQWLQQHDPKGFNWLEKGEPLISDQYMPNEFVNDGKDILTLINAAKVWVKKC